MFSGMIAAITAVCNAFSAIPEMIKTYIDWQQAQQMVLLGQLQQENATLRTENENLRARIAAIMAPGAVTPGGRL